MKLKSFVYLSLIPLVISLAPAAQAQIYSVIYTFDGNLGSAPKAGVTIQGSALFGTATAISNGYGSVYSLTRNGVNWTPGLVHIFDQIYHQDGLETPLARVVFGPDGHLYGTVFVDQNNNGAVFKLTPPLSICATPQCQFWGEDIPYSFRGGDNDGANPGYGDLVWDQQGNVYGTTRYGGLQGGGTVYEMMPVGNGWVEMPIYFGLGTMSGVIFDTNGNLFGAAPDGCCGIVYELQYAVGVGWTENAIYAFTGGIDGSLPSGVTFDNSGNLYGATIDGGVSGGGTIFELSPSGNTWTYKLLYSFSGTKHCGPARPLTIDAAGNLYGVTVCDGAYGAGNVFKLTSTPNGWVYSSLYDFTGGSDGKFPFSNVSIDNDGALYGTASQGGGQNSNGVVWMIKP